MKENEFIVGDYIYCEKGNTGEDYRLKEFIPVFKLQEISKQGYIWLRPQKDKTDGVLSSICRKATLEEIKQYLPEEHPDLLIKIPEKWVVRINNVNQIKDYLIEKYEEIHPWLKDKSDGFFLYSDDETFFNVPKYVSLALSDGYTLITFEFFEKHIKNNKEMKEEYKYTPEYCLDRGNKVIIRCESVKELKEIDKILGTSYTYFYNNRSLSHSFNVSEHCHANNEFYEKDSSNDIIEAKDFIKNNTKEMKKIIGAFCIKDFPNNRFGVKESTFTGVDFVEGSSSWNEYQPLKFPEFWKIQYEEEIKSKTLTLGDKGVKVIISKGKIEAEGRIIPSNWIISAYNRMNGTENLMGWEVKHSDISLGCTTFTKEEVKLVIDTYNELNS